MRVAVVGYGAWGPNHVRNFVNLLGVSNVVVVEADAERRAQAVERYPGIESASELSKVLGDPTVQAVCIATPTHTHFTLTRDALKAGKHVLCEKPLAETGEESVELVELARSSGRVLMVGFVFIHNPGIRALKTLITDGDLGSVYYLSAVRSNLGPIRDDVNAAFDLAAHDISIFNWLLEAEPVLVSALGGAFIQPGIEDVTFISLRYPNDV
ncbi:MAG: Gfo/Idh/MocA family oxidoreductase, partial [Acidimicrobiia bacterium]|nr:Gfo/Idh/MocA family oxidoreductase [Acidimicrobiia bacterium]